ncbi:MAG: hypothetical protein LIO44_02445 [Eubacterium sp.]|nr:hypothetical protein [Eubacterium sp.]
MTSESSITEDASEAEAKDKPEDKNRDSGAIEIPTDKDITEICSVSDKAVYVYGEKIKLTNSSGDKMDVYSYDPENHDVIYIPFDRLMLAMDYNLADESTSPSSIEVIFEKTEKTEGKNENSLKINGKEVSKVSVKKYEYEVYIDFFDSETGSETKTMLYPVLNMDDEDKNIYETYVPAGEFVRALGLNYDEQGDAIYIDEAKSERRKD